MKNKSGFLLISVCVYLVCFTLLIALTTRVLLPGLIAMQQKHRRCQEIMEMHMAADLLLRDLWTAPATPQSWYRCTQSTLVWQREKDAVGWYVTREGIQRAQGDYDATRHVWRKKVQSVVSRHTRVHFSHEASPDRMLMLSAHCAYNDIKTELVWSFYGR
jgi:type II secretory pathway component PulJ